MCVLVCIFNLDVYLKSFPQVSHFTLDLSERSSWSLFGPDTTEDWYVDYRLFLCCNWSFIKVQVQRLIFTVVTFLISTSQHEGISLLLQYKLLSLLTGAEFLLFLFNLWRLWVLLVQTGAPLLNTELLVSENLLLLTGMLLWELWRIKKRI